MIDTVALKNAQQANKNALDALLAYANEATQAGDTDIGEAIRTLVDGYGKGGGGASWNEFTVTEATVNSVEFLNAWCPQTVGHSYLCVSTKQAGLVTKEPVWMFFTGAFNNATKGAFGRFGATNSAYPIATTFDAVAVVGTVYKWIDLETIGTGGGSGGIVEINGVASVATDSNTMRINVDTEGYSLAGAEVYCNELDANPMPTSVIGCRVSAQPAFDWLSSNTVNCVNYTTGNGNTTKAVATSSVALGDGIIVFTSNNRKFLSGYQYRYLIKLIKE